MDKKETEQVGGAGLRLLAEQREEIGNGVAFDAKPPLLTRRGMVSSPETREDITLIRLTFVNFVPEAQQRKPARTNRGEVNARA